MGARRKHEAVGAAGMTKVVTRRDANGVLSEVYTRVRKLEQKLSSAPGGPGLNPSFDSVNIGGQILLPDINPPTDLVLTTGSFLDDIFIDASWTPPANGSAINYDVEIARKDVVSGTYQVQSVYQTGSNSIRIGSLQGNQTYGIRVSGSNRLGTYSTTLPPVGWMDIVTAIDATIPPVVSGVTLSRGATSAVVKFTPLTAEEAFDVANGNGIYEIELHSDALFTDLIDRKYTGDQITSFPDILTERTAFVRVRAIDSTGNAGPWGSPESGAFVGGVTDSMIVSGLDAAKITVGFLNGSRILADSIDVNKLTSSALTTQTLDLAGGQLRVLSGGTTGATRLLINSGGIHLYNTAGTRTGFLNTADGKATFSSGSFTGSVFSNQPSRRRLRTTNLSVPDTTFVTVAWSSDKWSNGDILIGAPSSSRLSAPRKGIYLLSGSIEWSSGPPLAGNFQMVARRFSDNENMAGQITNPGTSPCVISFAAPISCASGDSFFLLVYIISGGATKTIIASDLTYFSLHYLSDN